MVWRHSRRTAARRVNLTRCPHTHARGARRFQRALTQTDRLEPAVRLWSTSPFRFSGLLFADSGSGPTMELGRSVRLMMRRRRAIAARYGVIDNRSKNLQH